MPRNYYKRRYPKAYGTRYNSNRRYKGLYRTSSMYNLKGAARRVIGKYRLRKALSQIAEHKYFETGVTLTPGGVPLNAAGVITQLTAVPQGPGQNNRVGDKSTGTSLQVSFNAYASGLNTAAAFNIFRYILFIWKDDTAPTIADILEDPTYPNITPLNHDKKVKRKILYDNVFTQYTVYSTVATQSFADSMRPFIQKSIFIPLSKLRRYCNIYFQAGTTVGVNNIYELVISTNTGAANTTWNFESYTRYNFIDM